MPFVANHKAIKKRCEELFELYLAKKLIPLIAPIRPLSETPDVLKEMANRDTIGKLLLKP